ncbi:MAG: NAD(P)-dependent glycerol-3-phosphate dehydrogenase [Planctomycetes bacterium]|nr:NAD(P)-dependent glycerol-3-phosphate dehydrogenase [Planctomycetota bacterium]
MSETRRSKITVIGDGSFGTTLALVLLENGNEVTLWSRDAGYSRELSERRENRKFLPGVLLPAELNLTSDDARAMEGADYLVTAVPTKFQRKVLERLAPHYDALFHGNGARIVNVSKGMEPGTLATGSRIIAETLGASDDGRGSVESNSDQSKICVLSGPSHAEEVVRKLPTTVVVASTNQELAQDVQRLFGTPYFRCYTASDVVGVELGSVLKNVIAIAAGICDGLDFGDNTKSALMTRGLVEMIRLGAKLGAREETFIGLSGIGDLITTCVSKFGRNRAVGERIAKGETLAQIESSTDMVAEGVLSAKAIKELSDRMNVEMPITGEIYAVLFENKNPREAVRDLMLRDYKSEAPLGNS